ncbi:MAG: hypothetical protein KDA80_23950 [Planctomycetaceae bacterium]|nr:hypothetical protein [Planctomycetaceae bacterium]
MIRAERVFFHPREFVAHSSDPKIQRRLKRRQVGCVPEHLPIPRRDRVKDYVPPVIGQDQLTSNGE